MNNLLSYNDYFKNLIPMDQVNEGVIRNAMNKAAIGKVRSELADEIEMSKSIMKGISEGLDTLNKNFDEIKSDIENNNKDIKGENQKKLDEISKILESSKKCTWDLNELIDEGEIDYTGFTANIGLASVAYFGILLFPVRASIIIHKGYNYFFTLVKNTIRKALVMLQLNFDQFENLIIYQSFVSADYIRDMKTSNEVTEFYSKMFEHFFNSETGKLRNKRGRKELEDAMKLFKEKFDKQMVIDKKKKNDFNPYNVLDNYSNTYTKSLETLRQYSQDDIQKQLDAIKNSMNKFAVNDVDLQAYGELIIAAAEEHAYKVSSSIYNKFAKLTEVFSLPNQKKMIELITAATEESEKRADKEKRELAEKEIIKKSAEVEEEREKECIEIFKSIGGVSIGEAKDRKYSDVDAKKWTYSKFSELDEDKMDLFESWLAAHPEVLKECDGTLKVAIHAKFGKGSGSKDYTDYSDAIIEVVAPALKEDTVKKTSDSYVPKFVEYLVEKRGRKKHKNNSPYNNPDATENSEEVDTKKVYKIDLSEIESGNIERVKDMFVTSSSSDEEIEKKKELVKIALKRIGSEIVDDRGFTHNAKIIAEKLYEAFSNPDEAVEIKKDIYDILSSGIKKMKEMQSNDYIDESAESKEENKEKSEG